MTNTKIGLPQGFLLEITQFPGSNDEVCQKAIAHYSNYIYDPDPIVRQIAEAMVGNLNEYYNISHQGSFQFELALPHLSGVANFMDSKNTPSMDIQSTARIKSFYSTYEKLLIECSNKLERHEPIPTEGLAKDIIATRDVLSPRYQFKNDPQAFYRQTYGAILEFMDYIDNLHQTNPDYDFEDVDPVKRAEMLRIKKITVAPDEEFIVPNKDFVSYALEAKKIPEFYRHIIHLDTDMSPDQIKQACLDFQQETDTDIAEQLPIAKLIKSYCKRQSLIYFRNDLEQEFVDSMDASSAMYKDYKTKSRQDFLYINKSSLKPEFRDYLAIIDAIDSVLKEGKPINISSFTSLFSNYNISSDVLIDKLNVVGFNQKILYQSALDAVRALDLSDFDRAYAGAQKIAYYDSHSKDYMKYPKETGYQSFHITVKTPFGFYEKQFRTEAQHNHAEYGSASHSMSYKPYEKEDFHRLKVPTPLMPARDDNGDIIIPILLIPLDFDEAIKEYYHKDFEYFSTVPMDVFKGLHPDKESYDEALFSISQSTGSMLKRLGKKFSFLTGGQKKKTVKSTDDSDPFNR